MKEIDIQWSKLYWTPLTLYAPVWRIRHVLPKFLFYNKKESSEKFPMSVATMSLQTKRAYLRLCPEEGRKKNSGSKRLKQD